jgi:hypothetical protein
LENGVDWSASHGSNGIDGPNSRLRIGVAQCGEVLIDIPTYSSPLGGAVSGFSNVAVSIKRQLPMPLGFDLSATAGLGLPSGSAAIAGRGYQPYIQFPWSHELGDGWAVAGMLTVSWFTDDSVRNPTIEPTISLERALGPAADGFVEFVADFDHQHPAEIVDTGAAWRFTERQQFDFHAGFGLNRSSVDHFFGIGYSIRLDHLVPVF